MVRPSSSLDFSAIAGQSIVADGNEAEGSANALFIYLSLSHPFSLVFTLASVEQSSATSNGLQRGPPPDEASGALVIPACHPVSMPWGQPAQLSVAMTSSGCRQGSPSRRASCPCRAETVRPTARRHVRTGAINQTARLRRYGREGGTFCRWNHFSYTTRITPLTTRLISVKWFPDRDWNDQCRLNASILKTIVNT